MGTAIGAVLLPMAVVAFVMFFMATALTGWPLLGALAGLGAGYLAFANALPLLLGAVIGGILAPRPRP